MSLKYRTEIHTILTMPNGDVIEATLYFKTTGGDTVTDVTIRNERTGNAVKVPAIAIALIQALIEGKP